MKPEINYKTLSLSIFPGRVTNQQQTFCCVKNKGVVKEILIASKNYLQHLKWNPH